MNLKRWQGQRRNIREWYLHYQLHPPDPSISMKDSLQSLSDLDSFIRVELYQNKSDSKENRKFWVTFYWNMKTHDLIFKTIRQVK
jgi:hypothetical protein